MTPLRNSGNPPVTEHPWDEIRARQTSITTAFLKQMGLDNIGNGIHESLLRSWHVLGHVKQMLARGDSPETISEFIAWVETRRPDVRS